LRSTEFPVTDELAVARHAHGLQVGCFDRSAGRLGQRRALRLRADRIGFVLLQPIDRGDALRAERRLHHLLRRCVVVDRRRGCGTTGDRDDHGDRSEQPRVLLFHVRRLLLSA